MKTRRIFMVVVAVFLVPGSVGFARVGDPLLVKDINSGDANSFPSELIDVNGTLFFRANDGTHGYELWKSDRTKAGTVMVKDIWTGSTGSSPSELIDVNGTLFFRANDGTQGSELWKSDGSEGGTVMVKDIRSGSTSSSPLHLTDVTGTLFFVADDGTHGYELWKSDGSETGTVMVKDIWPGLQEWKHTDWLTDVNGTLFFIADDSNGQGLWKSSGTEETTVIVIQDSNVMMYNHLMGAGDTLFFLAYDDHLMELWKSDGTGAGTGMVKDINPSGYAFEELLDPRLMTITAVGSTLFFRADDGTHGEELWKSDGTEVGTVMVKDIYPGGPYDSSRPQYLKNVNGTLFFSAWDPCEGPPGPKLWKSDGTEDGTVRISSTGWDARPVTDVNGTLFFSDSTEPNGTELWQTDGTPEGTVMVKDIYPGPWPASSYPERLTDSNGALLFTANDGVYGRELWIYVDWSCSEAIAGDVNNDCEVDFRDFCVIASNWLICNRQPDYLCGM